jgi:N-acetylmuramoyl-L-alanine amidase
MWLVPKLQQFPTPKIIPASGGDILRVELLVIHYTAGPWKPSLDTLRDPKQPGSAHFLVGKDGRLAQLAKTDDRTEHAKAPPAVWRGQLGVNRRSLGIELENWGWLKRAPSPEKGPAPAWLRWTNAPHRGAIWTDPTTGMAWDPYPETQLAALDDLVRRLVVIFPILREGGDRIVGHRDVDPGRKQDPGPHLSLERLRKVAKEAPR